MVNKAAFTLIELIFAIVVIAVAVLSLPVLSRIIASNNEKGIVQEAIFAAATELSEASTAHWDENSLEAGGLGYARVIDLGGCDNNASSPHYRRMPGQIAQELHRRCLESNTTTVAGTNTNALVEALEDKAHSRTDIFINANASSQGYKDSYKSILTITHPATFAGSSNQNIKKIEVTVTKSDSTQPLVRLKSYSSNIGEIDYYKRSL